MLALGKSGGGGGGGGLIHGILTFPCDDHYRPLNAMRARDLRTFSGYSMGKTEKRQKFNITQIATCSLLAVATILLAYGL